MLLMPSYHAQSVHSTVQRMTIDAVTNDFRLNGLESTVIPSRATHKTTPAHMRICATNNPLRPNAPSAAIRTPNTCPMQYSVATINNSSFARPDLGVCDGSDML